jgi:hypothetical protein
MQSCIFLRSGAIHFHLPDLLKLASRIMAEPGARPSKIMWRDLWNIHARGSLLDNVPNRIF